MKMIGKPKEIIKPKKDRKTHLNSDEAVKNRQIMKQEQLRLHPELCQTFPVLIPISNTIKEQFITWLKSLDPNDATNNEVKRFRQKDGYFRESHVRGFVDLINYFIENYKSIINKKIN